MTDPDSITTEDELRSVIEAPHPDAETKVFDHIDRYAARFIARSPLVFMATADGSGNLDVSPKGDAPGFVQVDDERTLLVPDRKGNRLTYGFRNILATGQVGLIFLVPNVRETLRVNGRAELSRDPGLLERLDAQGKHALLVTRVHVREAFFHCGKALLRSQVWDSDTWPADFRPEIGKQLAAKMGRDAGTANELDEALEEDYRRNLY